MYWNSTGLPVFEDIVNALYKRTILTGTYLLTACCTYEKMFNVSLFLRSTTMLRLLLGLGPVTFQTSDPSD